jgi:hypothetical protein
MCIGCLPVGRLPSYGATVQGVANSVIGNSGELLEYHRLIANPKTKAVWAHSYGNKLGQLAQGM